MPSKSTSLADQFKSVPTVGTLLAAAAGLTIVTVGGWLCARVVNFHRGPAVSRPPESRATMRQ